MERRPRIPDGFRSLSQAGFEKLFKFGKRNFTGRIVIEIDMVRAGDDYQLFLFAADGLKGVFGKIAECAFSPVTISVGMVTSLA